MNTYTFTTTSGYLLTVKSENIQAAKKLLIEIAANPHLFKLKTVQPNE